MPPPAFPIEAGVLVALTYDGHPEEAHARDRLKETVAEVTLRVLRFNKDEIVASLYFWEC